MAGRASNVLFGLFVDIEIVDIQVISVFVNEAGALNRTNEFDTTLSGILNVFVTAIVCVCKHLSR